MEKLDIPVIATFVDLSLHGGRAILNGVASYARQHGPWRIINVANLFNAPSLDLSKLDVSGVFATSMFISRLSPLHRRGIPCVMADYASAAEIRRHGLVGIPMIHKDSHAIGRLAAEYFLERKYTHFAFIPDVDDSRWSQDRLKGFRTALHKSGFPCARYAAPPRSVIRRWHAERPQMIRFLKGLPTPCAVFAANDLRASYVLDACSATDLAVPEQIAVLGVDDDECICQTCLPSLSSVDTDSYNRGFEAARLLDGLMKGRNVRGLQSLQKPMAVRSRDSTAYGALHNPLLARAYFFIRDTAATQQIAVSDVVKVMNCSRRYAETLFSREIGHSIKDEIDRVRFERVKFLLSNTDFAIPAIAQDCGFHSATALYNQFLRKFKLSPRQFRTGRDSLQ